MDPNPDGYLGCIEGIHSFDVVEIFIQEAEPTMSRMSVDVS